MRFLRIKDYHSHIKQDNLNVILENSAGVIEEQFLIDVEMAAIKEVGSYLRHRYNTALIFTPVPKWSASVSYAVDEIIYYEPNNKTYKAIDISTNENPIDNANLWEEIQDIRDAQVKMYVIDLTLYHIHSRINPRNIPDLRLNRRDEAVKWLVMISKGDITVDLPERNEEDKTGYRIAWGSETKRINSY
jgi:phage gp36-like protein